MGETRSGPKLVLDHMVFYSMIADEKFFARVPAFFFMKDMCRAAYKEIVQGVLDKKCRGCGSNIRVLLLPIMEIFVNQVRELKKESPQALEPLVEYISQRKGNRPSSIVMFVKEDGQIVQVEI